MGLGYTCLLVSVNEGWCTENEMMTLAMLAGDGCSTSILVGGSLGAIIGDAMKPPKIKVVERRSSRQTLGNSQSSTTEPI